VQPTVTPKNKRTTRALSLAQNLAEWLDKGARRIVIEEKDDPRTSKKKDKKRKDARTAPPGKGKSPQPRVRKRRKLARDPEKTKKWLREAHTHVGERRAERSPKLEDTGVQPMDISNTPSKTPAKARRGWKGYVALPTSDEEDAMKEREQFQFTFDDAQRFIQTWTDDETNNGREWTPVEDHTTLKAPGMWVGIEYKGHTGVCYKLLEGGSLDSIWDHYRANNAHPIVFETEDGTFIQAGKRGRDFGWHNGEHHEVTAMAINTPMNKGK
jgi:hypothetical protein